VAVVWKKLAFAADAPSAHESTHVSGGSDDIDSALADAAIPNLAASKITSGQFSLDRMPRGTDTHILTGKGVGVNPAYEAAGGGGVSLTVPAGVGTEVFNGSAPTSWTDLNLSGTIGAQTTLVLLKFLAVGFVNRAAFRKNGDTDELDVTTAGGGAHYVYAGPNTYGVAVVATDSSGIVEWKCTGGYANTTVDVITYIK